MNKASVPTLILTVLTLVGLASYAGLRAPMQAAETGAAAPAATPAEEIPKVTYYLCKLGRQVRSLRVDIENSGCKAYYTKQGVDQEVGKSSDKDLCFRVTNRIRKTLEGGDWKCQDVSASKTSFN